MGTSAPARSARTWLLIVFPALILNYLGQGALILSHPAAVSNPFLLLVPAWGRFSMVILSTVATIIASQAAITGSFSVARQAVQLGFLPRVQIVHTSKLEGQIYVPVVNWGLCIGVIALVLAFQSSVRLADIYGVAVTGTFILNTLLFLAVARYLWRTAIWKLAILGALFLTVEIAFFSANLAKIEHGAWLSLAVALVISIGMITWRKGREIVTANRIAKEGPLAQFLDGLPDAAPPIRRVPGIAIFLNPGQETTPLALRAEVEHAHAMHDRVVIVSVETVSVPHVDGDDRFYREHLGRGLFKVIHLTVRCGYRDRQDIPKALALARKQGLLERDLDLEHASYFLSRISIAPSDAPGMSRWRKRLFVTMARNAASPIEHFSLPNERTVTIGSQIAV